MNMLCEQLAGHAEIFIIFLNDYAHKLPRIMLRNAIEMLEEDIRMNILVTSKEKRDGLK